jgi:hypothetical protein
MAEQVVTANDSGSSRVVLAHAPRQPLAWLNCFVRQIMRRRIVISLLAISVLLLSGCILLPIPHEQWLSPRFTGTVTDADTGTPLQGVKNYVAWLSIRRK